LQADETYLHWHWAKFAQFMVRKGLTTDHDKGDMTGNGGRILLESQILAPNRRGQAANTPRTGGALKG
jgi:hypothetical protein